MLEYKPKIYNKCQARFLNSRNIYAAHSLTHTHTQRKRHTSRASHSLPWGSSTSPPPPDNSFPGVD